MADPEHLAKLNEGVAAWNRWRQEHADVMPDLSGVNLDQANLARANLLGANLIGAILSKSDLREAILERADLSGARLEDANLRWAKMSAANLSRATLTNADLGRVDLHAADLRGAQIGKVNLSNADLHEENLSHSNLENAVLVETNLEGANLSDCFVYGVSVWNVMLKGAIQSNLWINRPFLEPAIQVDNLQVAQFVYLLLNNEEIRRVIDTITSKVLLILGRFTPERKAVLDAIRGELRKRDYVPVLFDFEMPDSKNLTGTITTLAKMSRFVIADLTDPSSVPHELAMIVPTTKVPVQAVLLEGQREYSMFTDLKTDYRWVLEPYQYKSKEMLIAQLNERVIAPAEAKAKELTQK